MSEQRARRRDNGFTLIEVLVTVSLIGIIMATISMATIVILKTRNSSAGRANNARSEQAIGLWMPGDLASAESVDTSPGAVPCGPSPACPPSAMIGGSNAVMLTWTSSTIDGSGNAVTTKTVVSYRVVQINGEYQMVRVLCTTIGAGAATCESKVVLHNLEQPPPGFTFVPGVTSPSWVITVSNALAADDTSGPDATVPPADPGLKNKNGQRVVVTINGGGEVAGAGGGQQQITLSAGGTNRDSNLATSDLTGAPTFTAARSRCGGNYAMLVDTSGSIGGAMGTVIAGVKAFVDTFAGTPIKLEVVRFSDTAVALGTTGSEWVHYYDMLVDSDVTALKSLVNGLVSNGRTNWEDGVFHLLKNSDGTTQANQPGTIIFFTDGVPTISRLNGTSASSAAVTDPLDGGLPAPDFSNFYQIGWNRAERLIRDRGGIDIIGVMVGSTTATSSWKTAGPGYHWVYQIGDNVVFQRGYHAQTQVGNAVLFERGYHAGYEVGNSTLFERGYHAIFQRNNNVTYQIGTNNIHYQKQVSGNWVSAAGNGSDSNSSARSAYLTGNTTPDSSDKYRLVMDATPTSWTPITTLQYTQSNVSAGGSDGVQSTVGALSGSWTTVTAAEYNAGNTTTDNTDGWQDVRTYSSPYDYWETSNLASYLAGNTNNASTDGWRNSGGGSSTAWTEVTSAQYTASNTSGDSTDGWRAGNIYTAPYSSWQTSTQAAFLTGNTNATSTDGWRSTGTGTSTSWTDVTSAQYNVANTTADATDGWQAINNYTSPFNTWETTTRAAYEAGNTVSGGTTDGWKTITSGTGTSWTDVTKALYDASNSTTDGTDGWQAVKTYSTPYDAWDAVTSKTIKDYATLGNIVVDNTSGDEGVFVKAVTDASGTYTNAAAADLFVLPDYTKFSQALSTIALGQCGGTVTMQTRLGSGTAAQDPFTYQISSTNEVVQTSAAYRSGTFDVALPGGAAQTVTISPQEFTNLVRYTPSSWSCKSSGVAYPFTVVPVTGHAPWTAIQLTVNPNQAVSCIQTVTFT